MLRWSKNEIMTYVFIAEYCYRIMGIRPLGDVAESCHDIVLYKIHTLLYGITTLYYTAIEGFHQLLHHQHKRTTLTNGDAIPPVTFRSLDMDGSARNFSSEIIRVLS